MKKVMAMVLTLAMVLCSASALAAGKLTVNQETYFVTEGYSLKCFVFAEVENTGDKNIEFDNGLLEMLTEDGEPTDNANIYRMYPEVLAPGEKGYIVDSEYCDDGVTAADVADHSLNVTGKSTKEDAPVRLDAKGTLGKVVSTWGGDQDAVQVVVTNNTTETVYGCNVVYALYDANDTLLCVDTSSLYNQGLPAGQSVEVLFSMDEDLQAKWTVEGLKPARVEALVYADDMIASFTAE